MKKEKSPLIRTRFINRDSRRDLRCFVPCLLVGILSLSISPVEAADKYVRKGASGANNGTDWTNAYTELNQVSYSGLSGSTLYIAAGNYTTGLPTMNNVDNVTIRRATVASHGTNAGWADSYDGQVTHNSSGKFLSLNGCDNVVVDGGGTKEPWLFRVVGQNAYDGKLLISEGSNITIRYLELDGNGCQPNIVGGPEDGMRILHANNLILEHNWIHDYWYCNFPGNTGHSDAIQMPSGDGVIIRYNKLEDSGMLLFVGDCEWGGQIVDNLHAHHNIFIQRSGTLGSNEDNYYMICAKGIQRSGPTSYFIIENNTFYSVGWSGPSILETVAACNPPAGNTVRRVIRNNVFVPANVGMSIGQGSASHNLSFGGSTVGSNAITSNPLFVNTAAYNFRLQAGSPAADSGTSTALGYGDTITVDYDGNPIGSVRSRGAFEYASGSPPPDPGAVISVSPTTLNFGTVSVGANASLAVEVRNTGSGTLSGLATASAPFSVVSGGSYNLGAGQSQTVTVRYAPTSTGVHNSSVSFSGGSGASVSVAGTAQTGQGPGLGLTFDAVDGTITSPFIESGAGYISQSIETEFDDSGRAVYVFNITTAGNYTISANVNAPSEGTNSLYINIDAEPTDPTMIWDVPVTNGFQDRTVGWRGNGSFNSPQYPTKVFNLSAGSHQLIIRGRESDTQLRRITLVPSTSGIPSPPTNLRVIAP